MNKLGTLQPIDGDRDKFDLPGDARSLIWQNALSAPIFGSWGRRPDPSTGDYDVVLPGSSMGSLPVVDGENQLQLVVRYPGAVPAGDANLLGQLWTSSCPFAPAIGPIA